MKAGAGIFDLDGVLVDTARFHYLAWNELAAELGFEFTMVHNERLKGVSRMDSLEILLEIGNIQLSAGEKNLMAERKNSRYLQYVDAMTEQDILPGVITFLQKMRESGKRIALGSVSKNARIILQRTGMIGFFDAIVDGTLISKAKPHPEVFLTGAGLMNLPPEACVVFEDAVAGIEAAHRAGMKCVGVGDASILNQADLIISGFHGILPEHIPL